MQFVDFGRSPTTPRFPSSSLPFFSGSSQQRLLGNHISNSEDLDSIDYYPEVGGRPAQAVKASPGGHRAGPRPFIKYNSFANY